MQTFQTPEPISVTLELGVGHIRVVASDRTDTTVDVRPTDSGKKADVQAAAQTRVEYANGVLVIKAPKRWRQLAPWGGNESIDVQVDLPAGSHLRGETGVVPLHCTGRLGECRYKSGVGDIHIDEAGPVELTTGAGEIAVAHAMGHAELTSGTGALRIGSIDGTAVTKNGNGDTIIRAITGDLRASAANGKVTVDQAGASVVAKTANGDVRVGDVVRGAIRAETGHGKVVVGVRDGVAVWLDLNTHFGNVQNELDAAERPAAGGDAVEVRARTAFGDITIRRSFANDGRDVA
jgi:DUF4097 and DUF4098 domain-containing protein YvlB